MRFSPLHIEGNKILKGRGSYWSAVCWRHRYSWLSSLRDLRSLTRSGWGGCPMFRISGISGEFGFVHTYVVPVFKQIVVLNVKSHSWHCVSWIVFGNCLSENGLMSKNNNLGVVLYPECSLSFMSKDLCLFFLNLVSLTFIKWVHLKQITIINLDVDFLFFNLFYLFQSYICLSSV